MRQLILLLLLFCFFLLNKGLHAEGNCPQGFYPIGASGQPGPQGCAPMVENNQTQMPSQLPAPKWATRWGSIVYDQAETNVGLGIAQSQDSKEQAESMALADCKAKGGAGCTIDLTYYNQCAVVIAGFHYVRSQGASTIQEASNMGLNDCARSGESRCTIYYSACSLPERIQ